MHSASKHSIDDTDGLYRLTAIDEDGSMKRVIFLPLHSSSRMDGCHPSPRCLEQFGQPHFEEGASSGKVTP